MTVDFTLLLGGLSRAAHDRYALLCSLASMGREVSEDVLLDRMATVKPPWTWEEVLCCARDLVDGGALDVIRNSTGTVVGFAVTDDAAEHLAVALACGLASNGQKPAGATPGWLIPWVAEARTSLTSSKAVAS